MIAAMALRPLVAICGTTGVGKSKLAIEMALQLAQAIGTHGWRGARIINADSMQVYSGMDVITNKVPEAERQGIEHLLMGFRQPGEQYVVGEWVQDAIDLINETHSRQQVPIVVGGTSYWIQHLIFPHRLSSTLEASTAMAVTPSLSNGIASLPRDLADLFDHLPEEPPPSNNAKAALSLHRLLTALDPLVAARWHWRDTRKVLRSLSIMKQTGRQNSELISQQDDLPLVPRYRTLCLWLYAAPESLNPRLDERIDEMIKNGLLDEIRALREISSSRNQHEIMEDYTTGIYQAIGYKEFHEYMNSPESAPKAFESAVENMKLSTRRYAKKQVSWIRNKLLPAVKAANALSDSRSAPVPTYLLDATELGEKWTTNVGEIAEKLVLDFLSGNELPDPPTLSETARVMLTVKEKATMPTAVLCERRKIICHVCTVNPDEPVMLDEADQWDVHVKTRAHRRLARKFNSQDHIRSAESESGVTSPQHSSGRLGHGRRSPGASIYLDAESHLDGSHDQQAFEPAICRCF